MITFLIPIISTKYPKFPIYSDWIYNNQLLPILKQKATHSPGDAGDYDLSNTIINDN